MNMHSAIQKCVYICMFVYTFIQQGCINWSKVTVNTFIVLEKNINKKNTSQINPVLLNFLFIK